MLIKGKTYLIEWDDHYSTASFLNKHDPEIVDEMSFKSVGFFIKADKKYTHFAQTIGAEDCADILSILKKSTLNIKELS